MAKDKLSSYVTIHDKDGGSTTYGPDDDVPAEVAKLITNPAAWESGVEPGPGEDGGPAVPGTGQALGEAEDAEGGDGNSDTGKRKARKGGDGE
ncbi:MAG: hypothetical protein ACR2M4_02395 [Actinomycetota bacterium]